MRIRDDLADLTDRRTRHPDRLQLLGELSLTELPTPAPDELIHPVDDPDPGDPIDVLGVGGELRHAHQAGEGAPVALTDADEGDVAVAGGINVVWRLRHAGVAVAGPGGGLACAAEEQAEAGHQARIDRVEHCRLDRRPTARLLALVQAGHDGAVQMDAAHEVAEGGACLHGVMVRKAGDGHDP